MGAASFLIPQLQEDPSSWRSYSSCCVFYFEFYCGEVVGGCEGATLTFITLRRYLGASFKALGAPRKAMGPSLRGISVDTWLCPFHRNGPRQDKPVAGALEWN